MASLRGWRRRGWLIVHHLLWLGHHVAHSLLLVLLTIANSLLLPVGDALLPGAVDLLLPRAVTLWGLWSVHCGSGRFPGWGRGDRVLDGLPGGWRGRGRGRGVARTVAGVAVHSGSGSG